MMEVNTSAAWPLFCNLQDFMMFTGQIIMTYIEIQKKVCSQPDKSKQQGVCMVPFEPQPGQSVFGSSTNLTLSGRFGDPSRGFVSSHGI